MLYKYRLILNVLLRLHISISGSVQCCPARTQILFSAIYSATSELFIPGISNVKTQILDSQVLLPIILTLFSNLEYFSSTYLINFSSFFTIVSYHQIDLMYSKALKKLTAQTIFGVPGSNLCGSPDGIYSCLRTQLIAHHQPTQGVNSFNNSFLPYSTQIPVSAITLCPVITMKSQSRATTSTWKFGTAWLQSTTNMIFGFFSLIILLAQIRSNT